MPHQTNSMVCFAVTLLVLLSTPSQTVSAQRSTSKKPPTFSKEIVRIFQNRCQSCHHPNSPITPMSLVNYNEVRPWAKSIKRKVVLREMPPWHADSSPGEFTNDPSITQQEIDAISQWVESRAPRGNRADLPPAKIFHDDWKIGTPDLILDMGVDFIVPATGPLPLQHFSIDTDFEEDIWLSGVEARPGDPAVVQQIDIYVQNSPEGIEIPDGGSLGNGLLGFYARGETSSMYKKGEGKLIKPGAKIHFQILYGSNGTATKDRSMVGFTFHKKPVQKHVITRGIAETRFEIPPHNPEFSIYATYTFTEPVTLVSMRPLMHHRGKEFKFIAHYPDDRDVVILHINRYNYDWQRYYYPKDPIKLPSGTVLECIAIMDNSHENINNPMPHVAVRFGDQLVDEKMIGWIDYTYDNEMLHLKEETTTP